MEHLNNKLIKFTSNILEIVESTKLKQLEAQYFINLL